MRPSRTRILADITHRAPVPVSLWMRKEGPRMCILTDCPRISQRTNCWRWLRHLARCVACGRSRGMYAIARVGMVSCCMFSRCCFFAHIVIIFFCFFAYKIRDGRRCRKMHHLAKEVQEPPSYLLEGQFRIYFFVARSLIFLTPHIASPQDPRHPIFATRLAPGKYPARLHLLPRRMGEGKPRRR